jgi:hypothetical protein
MNIYLPCGRVAIVDPEDFDRAIARGAWRSHRSNRGRTYYARVTTKSGDHAFLHRFLLGAGAGDVVDHRDGNGLNCTRLNLRVTTRALNNTNQPKRGARSKFKGVWPAGPSWCAMIASSGKRLYLGTFPTEIGAAMAYDVAARQLHGEFARTNAMLFPEAFA